MENLENIIEKISIMIANEIKFYEERLPESILKECRLISDGTEYYIEILYQKYEEKIKNDKDEQ